MQEIMGQFATTKEVQLGLLLAGLLVVYLVLRTSVPKLEKMAGNTAGELDDKIVSFVKKLYVYSIASVAIIGGLGIYGVEITPLLASAGVISVVVGMSLKEGLTDMFSGLFILADRPFAEGDRIQIKKPSGPWGGWGNVAEIGLRRTKVENTDGVVVNYTNSELAQSTVINFSDKNQANIPVRVRVRFAVSWSADLDKTIEITREAIRTALDIAQEKDLGVAEISAALSIPDGVKNTEPVVLVRSIWSDSLGMITPGVLLEGRYFLADVRDRTKVRSIVLKEILSTLLKHGIPLPETGPVPHIPAQE